jgi:uracil-DNA glycosylase family 4
MSAKTLKVIESEVIACTKCRELRRYCADVARTKKRAYRHLPYWGKPVPGFGDPRARVLLVGLAPGAHGSNRTGRPFTGDASGEFLYPALHRAGFANQASALHVGDGLELHDCFITAALRCAPPKNKPTPTQLRKCFPYLVREFEALDRLRIVIGLGAIGTKAAIEALEAASYSFSTKGWRFGHGAELTATKGERTVTLISSFHPSRQNTNTGKLTRPMFDAIFTRARKLLAQLSQGQ